MEYFESISKELDAVKDRVKGFIENSHNLSDGEWKESILRTVIKRYLPETIGIGRGFFITEDHCSSQIDILIYDKTKPILFKDGNFVIVTPDLVLGIIEVKTKITYRNYQETLTRINSNTNILRQKIGFRPFVGLFAFEHGDIDNAPYLLEKLQEVSEQNRNIEISAISADSDWFIKYWDLNPENQKRLHEKWHLYNLTDRSQAYFIHNVIEHLCPESVLRNNELWYPTEGKELYKIDEIESKNA